MNKIKFFISRAFRMDYQAMWQTTKLLKVRSGKSRIWLLCDMLYCALRYNAGYIDYKIAEFYKLNGAQRKTQITRGISNQIVKKMNPKGYWHFFDDKSEFNQLFSKEVNRKWIVVNEKTSLEDFENFLDHQQAIIVKPLEGSSGQGIEKFTSECWQEKNHPAVFLSQLIAKGPYIAEEIVHQHPLLSAMSPTSVNTIRVATLLGEKAQGIVYAFLRIGNGKIMDNVDCGGMAARVDLDSGKLLTVGADKQGNTFDVHPRTNTPIVGFTIPFWNEVKQMCLDASQVVPQMGYIAWDVAVTPDGPCFIEGNSFPSHAVPQFAAHYPDGIGILLEFQKFIDI
ncbi:MAG: hypothetical protein GX786_07275 [Clostridiales bacterium]|nr:hypothetical protein [Clostridiales bacterium]